MIASAKIDVLAELAKHFDGKMEDAYCFNFCLGLSFLGVLLITGGPDRRTGKNYRYFRDVL